MFQLENLPKVVTKKRKRIGIGEGSGLGKNAGFGHKGQKKRSGKLPVYFTGINSGAGSALDRLPKKRGFKARAKKQFAVLYIEQLVKNFDEKTLITLDLIKEKTLIDQKVTAIKIIKGKLTDKIQGKIKFDENTNITLSSSVKELIA